jgi:hypothetical protein
MDRAKELFPNVELCNKVRAYATSEDKKTQSRKDNIKHNKTERRVDSRKRFKESDKGKASVIWFKQSVTCICGRILQRKGLRRHERTKNHRKKHVLKDLVLVRETETNDETYESSVERPS